MKRRERKRVALYELRGPDVSTIMTDRPHRDVMAWVSRRLNELACGIRQEPVTVTMSYTRHRLSIGSGPRRRKMVLYTVYRKKTDELVALDEPPARCAELMGVSVASFHAIASRFRHGYGGQKWEIYSRVAGEEDEVDMTIREIMDQVRRVDMLCELIDGYCSDYVAPAALEQARQDLGEERERLLDMTVEDAY